MNTFIKVRWLNETKCNKMPNMSSGWETTNHKNRKVWWKPAIRRISKMNARWVVFLWIDFVYETDTRIRREEKLKKNCFGHNKTSMFTISSLYSTHDEINLNCTLTWNEKTKIQLNPDLWFRIRIIYSEKNANVERRHKRWSVSRLVFISFILYFICMLA